MTAEGGMVRLGGVAAITFDFGGTLVRLDRADLRAAARLMADRVVSRLGPFDRERFLDLWAEERDRQFREEVPRFREVDLDQRFARVLARIRGMPSPGEDSWDDRAAGALSDPAERAWAVEAYGRAFVTAIPPAPEVGPFLRRLADRHVLAILSNWPLASTLDRYVAMSGWAPYLRAIVVSQRVGTIKPHPAIFAAAASSLGDPSPEAILHVGDDWQADVIGAKRVGWRAVYLPDPTPGSPFPRSVPDDSVVADLVLDRLLDLEVALAPG